MILNVQHLNFHLPEFKILYAVLMGKTYFPLCSLIVTESKSQDCGYTITIFQCKRSDGFLSLEPPVQTFITRTHHDTYRVDSLPFSPYSKCKQKVLYRQHFVQERSTSGMRLPRGCFPEHDNLKLVQVDGQSLSIFLVLTIFTITCSFTQLVHCFGGGTED